MENRGELEEEAVGVRLRTGLADVLPEDVVVREAVEVRDCVGSAVGAAVGVPVRWAERVLLWVFWPVGGADAVGLMVDVAVRRELTVVVRDVVDERLPVPVGVPLRLRVVVRLGGPDAVPIGVPRGLAEVEAERVLVRLAAAVRLTVPVADVDRVRWGDTEEVGEVVVVFDGRVDMLPEAVVVPERLFVVEPVLVLLAVAVREDVEVVVADREADADRVEVVLAVEVRLAVLLLEEEALAVAVRLWRADLVAVWVVRGVYVAMAERVPVRVDVGDAVGSTPAIASWRDP